MTSFVKELIPHAALHTGFYTTTRDSNGYDPPVLMSLNVDGGPEFNEMLMEGYRELYGYRIWLRK